MSITTKRGDKGETDLYWGGRVGKDHARIEANGMLDELSSFLGLLKCMVKPRKIKLLLACFQNDLLLIGAEIATKTNFLHRLKKKITAHNVRYLEECIAAFEKDIRFRSFSPAGENFIANGFDVARVLARKLERCAVTLMKRRMLQNQDILAYLNRLSDLLYLLSRSQQRKFSKTKD